MSAIIYTRFSPRKNADECESCETQRACCEQYAREQGYSLAGYYEDKAFSGGDESRPGLFAALARLTRGDVLIVYKRDRLARDTYLAESIRRRVRHSGATIEAVRGEIEGDQDDPMIDAIRKILDVIDELARKTTAQRTSDAMRQHQRTGRRMGRFPPYGWTIDLQDPKRMLPAAAEVAAIEFIRARKHIPVPELVRILNREVPTAARAGTWRIKTVRRLVRECV
jgi:DNA invertase Pin-like site-specific DNA recombinase